MDVVAALLDKNDLRQSLFENHLRRIPDFQRLAKKFQRKKASLQDCYRVYQALEKIPHLLEEMEKCKGQQTSLFMDVFTNPIKVSEQPFDF